MLLLREKPEAVLFFQSFSKLLPHCEYLNLASTCCSSNLTCESNLVKKRMQKEIQKPSFPTSAASELFLVKF